jgi:DNA-binding NarL/FixJ family response regulator
VVDAELGGGESIGQLAELLNGDRERQAVVMVETETVEVATAAVKAGALAVMAKSAPLTSLVDAVLGVARGEGYLSPRLLAAVLGRLWEEEHEARATAALFNALTQREQDVLRLMIEGLDYPAIARELYSSVNTVRTHAQSLLRKLGVHSGIEAVSLARRVGWGSGRPSAT